MSRDHLEGGPARVGGMPYWSSRALRALGAHATIATRCAEADRDQLLPPLVAHGLPVRWRPASSTHEFSFRYDGDRREMHIDALGEPWQPADLPDLRDSDWVHVGALARSDFPAETVAALAGKGRRVSLDGQGLVRPARTGPLRLDAEFDREILRYLTVLKLAEEEALTMLREITRESLASLKIPEITVTYGSRGAHVLADGEMTFVAARPVDAEPTGTGDSFSAGYVASRAAGHGPVAAARRATALVGGLLSGQLPV